jgi:TIR domain-containing protein
MKFWAARRKIFLSYRRADTQTIADRVYEELSEYFGASNIFLDRPDIEPGQRWRDELTTQIGAADTVLALIGPRWLEALQARAALDDVLRFEIASALAQNKHIVPMLVGATPMPDSALLPPELRGLGQFQALVINPQDIDRAIRELLGRLKPGWGLAVAWAFASELGWVGGLFVSQMVLIPFVADTPDHPYPGSPPVIGLAIAGALFGICVAVPQWLVLRPWFERASYLVPLYAILTAIVIGFAGAMAGKDSTLAGAFFLLMILLVLPVGFCAILWAIVRKNLNHAGWWSVANMAAPLVGLMLTAPLGSPLMNAANPSASGLNRVNLEVIAYLLVTTFVSILLSGLLLVALMRRSKRKRK